MFTLELGGKVVHQAIVKVFTTQVGITSSGLDFEDTLLNSQEGYIESTSAEIEDEDVTFAGNLLVETVGNGSGSWLVDDTEYVKSRNDTSILGGLSL